MKKYVVALIVLIFVNYGFAGDCSMNVGTVLFAPSDANKDCWSADSLALLTSRMVLEGILPDKASVNINDGQIINDIIEYFRLILEVVRKNIVGKTKHIMLMALTDALGGYMKHFFLPVAKYAYYAGNIDYNSVIRVYQLFDELKNYLRTNGAGWSKPPKDIGKDVVAEPISLQSTSSKTDPCKGLVFSTTVAGSRARDRRTLDSNILEIPMPYFDSKNHPSAIAVPFKAYSLRNMEAKSASYILVKYYIAATKCLMSKSGSDKSVQEFNTNLFAFITKKVQPHFSDEKFYSAFGGVLRIVETMKNSGYVKNGKIIGSFNIMPDSEEKSVVQEQLREQQDEEKNIPPLSHGVGHMTKGGKMSAVQQKELKHKKNKSNLILLAALATIIIWFFLGACFICCRIRSARIKRDEQLKLIEGATDRKSTTSTESTGTKTTTKCLSSASSKTKCSSRSLKGEPCTKATCPNFAPSSSATIIEVENENEYESQKSEATMSKDEEEAENTPKTGSSVSSRSSKSASEKASTSSTPKSSPAGSSAGRILTAQYYPATFACHSSITGKYKAGSSSEEFSSKDTIKKPFVFGYDFQTTSEESSPRETSDGETEMGGNMSK